MNNRYKISAAALAVLALAACSKMDSNYNDFWKNGEKVYPASPDSLHVFSGRNRVKINWLIIGDPSVSKAVVYWNNGTDSLEKPITYHNDGGADTITVILDNLPEGTYSFDIYTYDKQGNRSVDANVVGKVYGDSYQKALLGRLVKSAAYVDDTLRVQWGDPADASATGSEITYTDTTGKTRTRMVATDADTTVIADYSMQASRYIGYRTLFLPDSTAIDTFATAYDSVRVLGPRTNLPKAGWTVTASSYDNRGGRTDRTPEKAIDENTSTAWINLVGSTDYPHSITIDMGAMTSDLYGVSLYLVKRNETPSSVDVYVSNDGTNWQLMGLYNIQNATGWQYLDFPQPQDFRYFRVKALQGYNSPNIVIYEAGVYTR
jgi:hypothetical protein